MLSVKDIIKKSFLENFGSGGFSLKTLLVCLLVAALLGIYIYLIYRLVSDKGFYSKTFNLSLMLMCVITAAIILTIQNSVVVSLGMVGALSIVRFRTAVKEPLDLIFLFWSISVGIITGAGMIGLAALLSGVVTLLLLVFSRMPEQRKSLILSVNAVSNDIAPDIFEIVKKYDPKYCVKSRNLSADGMDMLLELRMKENEEFLKELNTLKGVRSISLIAHRGESVY